MDHSPVSRMPLLFVGHGSSINLILENSFTLSLREIGNSIPHPRAIALISSHWSTPEIRITSAEFPAQMYDNIEFKEELHHIDYPVRGDPALAEHICDLLLQNGFNARTDDTRGLDIATWGVVQLLFPSPIIPVVEISLSYKINAPGMVMVGKALAPLRDEEVLLIGSGNLVHNLSEASHNLDTKPHQWAIETDQALAELLDRMDAAAFADFIMKKLRNTPAIPTPEHILPAVAILGAACSGDRLRHFHHSFQKSSISMRSFIIETQA
ncbi:MAG: dioxygenase [Rectinema sp.]|nr:dioxygenase [Rectinema sp.]